jgi:hypothetical protein
MDKPPTDDVVEVGSAVLLAHLTVAVPLTIGEPTAVVPVTTLADDGLELLLPPPPPQPARTIALLAIKLSQYFLIIVLCCAVLCCAWGFAISKLRLKVG